MTDQRAVGAVEPAQVQDRPQVLLELAGHDPSIVQCPELCGRMASSLTRKSGGRRAPHLEHSRPRGPGHVQVAGDLERGRAGPRRQVRGAGPGPARPPPCRSRRSAPSPRPATQRPAPSGCGPRGRPARARNRPGPRPAMPSRSTPPGQPVRRLSQIGDDRHPCRRTRRSGSSTPAASRPPPNSARSEADRTSAQGGPGIPLSVSWARIAALSWANHDGRRTGTQDHPSTRQLGEPGCGTCSWSKVTTSQPAANDRSASRSSAPRRSIRHDLGGAGVGRLGEHPQPQRGRPRRGEHPRQLPPPTTPTRGNVTIGDLPTQLGSTIVTTPGGPQPPARRVESSTGDAEVRRRSAPLRS